MNNTKHNNKTHKVRKIPTFNTKFSLRGSSLAGASANHPGGHWKRPPGMGGELVVIRDLHQGSSATSSLANSQQQSSAIWKPNKHKKHQIHFRKKTNNKSQHKQQHKQQQTHKQTTHYTAKTQTHQPQDLKQTQEQVQNLGDTKRGEQQTD